VSVFLSVTKDTAVGRSLRYQRKSKLEKNAVKSNKGDREREKMELASDKEFNIPDRNETKRVLFSCFFSGL
jgi:hypothetical protein